MTLIDLSALQTEGQNPRTASIDRVSTPELCRLINDEDVSVADAVAKCIPAISDAIDAVAPRIRDGGRLIYVGAGTSGRLGVVDASEIPPTFSAPHGQFIALMAGGDAAMRIAQEGAEDDVDAAATDLSPLNLDPDLDSLIGIAASGRTPYVLGAMEYAKKLGCITIGLACSEPSVMSTSDGLADYMISAVTGPEVVTGSTRMKAGTATKLVLNMLSAGIMIKIGKTYGNMMVDLKASNLKLEQRSRNIIRKLGGPSCPPTDAGIDAILAACGSSVKLALATLALGVTPDEARKRLEAAGGKLASILESEPSVQRLYNSSTTKQAPAEKVPPLVLYIDGGGSKCAATVLASDGHVGEGAAGPCNVTDVGITESVAAIKLAAQRALDSFASKTAKLSLDSTRFSAVWIGLAGHDRPEVAARLGPALSAIFQIAEGGTFKLGNDIDVLATAGVTRDIVVLIAGTGSVCMKYTPDFKNPIGEHSRCGRSGGWGHLLGDDGGGYDLGRQAIRATLYALDELRVAQSCSSTQQLTDSSIESLPSLARMVISHFGASSATNYDLLSSVLTGGGTDAKSMIAKVARLVLEAAEKELDQDPPADTDSSAKAILGNGVAGLIRTLKPLLREPFSTGKATLILGGSLLTNDSNEVYQAELMSGLKRAGIEFVDVKAVTNPSRLGASTLAQKCFGLNDY